MNTKAIAVSILAMSLILSGCASGQLLGPKLTPTSPPTSTSAPTSTPIPTPTQQFFAIQDESFKGFQQDCKTDASITSVDGDSFGIAANSTISMLNDEWALFCYGAKHTWVGTLIYSGYTFASDEKDPLIFTVDASQGYLYTNGKGSVTSPDGNVTNFRGGGTASSNAESANTPSPLKNGIPVVTSVDQRRDTSSGRLVIFQDISFKDSDGDVTGVDYEIVSSTVSGLQVEGGSVDISRAIQKTGAVITGEWGCGNENYEVTLRVTLTDQLGNQSDPFEYTMTCDN